MSGFDLAAVFLVIVGATGWLNTRFLHLPTATVMVMAGLAGSGLLLLAQAALPQPNAALALIRSVGSVDFPRTVLGYMLAFLLFAGAMQVNLGELRQRMLPILSLATLGVLASTAIVGLGLWYAAQKLALGLPLAWALVFGALISPTDPVAVLAAVRSGSLSKTVEAVLQGEALFNDGVGIVVFSAALDLASGGARPDLPSVAFHVGVEALGGLALGSAGALVAIGAMRAIDDYGVEVGISIALAVAAYAAADAIHVSGPIAVVAAGLMVGNLGVRTAMSDLTQRYVRGFWTLVDDILNALLFLLLGLEVLVIRFQPSLAGLSVLVLLLVFAARLFVVLPWGIVFRMREGERGASVLLAWGGLHGALSLALALSLPRTPFRETILSITFVSVIASVLVQGLTFGWLARRLSAPARALE